MHYAKFSQKPSQTSQQIILKYYLNTKVVNHVKEVVVLNLMADHLRNHWNCKQYGHPCKRIKVKLTLDFLIPLNSVSFFIALVN